MDLLGKFFDELILQRFLTTLHNHVHRYLKAFTNQPLLANDTILTGVLHLILFTKAEIWRVNGHLLLLCHLSIPLAFVQTIQK